MKFYPLNNIGILFSLLLFSFQSYGQLFSGPGGTAITDVNCVTESVMVTGVGLLGPNNILENVSLNIAHTWDADLTITLTSPATTKIILSAKNGGAGDNYIVTNFTDTGVDGVITAGAAPFNGSFIPEELLSVFDGEDADGLWTIEVCDDANGDEGMLNAWSLLFLDPLPIELISFDGHIMKNGNKLRWATASEVGAQFHVVERSHNGVDSWREIGRLDAMGTSTDQVEYEFMDENPLVKSYYRLNTIDYDRSEQISELISLIREADGFGIANAFPNPAINMVTVQYYSPKNSDVSVTISDVAGRIIQHFEDSANDGFNSMSINMVDLASGTYFLSLSNDIDKFVERIVKK